MSSHIAQSLTPYNYNILNKMPHSTTKKHRPKRPDARPNGKRRNKERLKVVEKMEAKDLITTRIPKAEHKERPVTGVLRGQARIPAEESRVRALQKVLRQIQALAEKQSEGAKLDPAQLAKLGRFDAVIDELEELLPEEVVEKEVEEEVGASDEEEVEEEVVEEVKEVPAKRQTRRSSKEDNTDDRKKKKSKTR
jgi:hypothetical protein